MGEDVWEGGGGGVHVDEECDFGGWGDVADGGVVGWGSEILLRSSNYRGDACIESKRNTRVRYDMK